MTVLTIVSTQKAIFCASNQGIKVSWSQLLNERLSLLYPGKEIMSTKKATVCSAKYISPTAMPILITVSAFNHCFVSELTLAECRYLIPKIHPCKAETSCR